MSNELMTTNAGGLSLISRINEFQTVAKLFAESGMFSDARGQAQCFVKIMAGAELGLPPFTSMNAFHVIQGKPTMAANTIAARLKASGKYNYRIVEKSATKCTIDFFEDGEKVHTETWDTDRAKRANVKNMAAFPEAMLFARAITSGARAIAPDVVGQFYTPDELGADVDAEGNIMQVTEPHRHEPDAPQIETPAEPNYKPVRNADRAAVSALLDSLNEARSVAGKLGADATDEQKRAFAVKFRDLITAINAQLTLRELPAITETKVTPAIHAAQRSIDAMIDYDAKVPVADAVIEAQPA